MSKEKIIASARRRFATFGFYTTSLAEIAADAGIRKPTIYSHFQAKRDIYMHLLLESYEMEKACLQKLTDSASDPGECVRAYLFNIPLRFDENYHLHFWLRAIYMPPAELESDIRNYDREYAALLDESVKIALIRWRGTADFPLPLAEAVNAYTGILRGIHTELFYMGRQKIEAKLHALWKIFEMAFLQDK